MNTKEEILKLAEIYENNLTRYQTGCLKTITLLCPQHLLEKAVETFEQEGTPIEQIFIWQPTTAEYKEYKIEVYTPEVLKEDNCVLFIDHDFSKTYSLTHSVRLSAKKGYYYPLNHSLGMSYSHCFKDIPETWNKIKTVYNSLCDEKSREVFLRCLNANIENEAGYFKYSDFGQYQHPIVKAAVDDVVIDGGISSAIDVLERFANTAGENGHVYGFEPSPIEYASAKEKLDKSNLKDKITLYNLGLWNKKDKMKISKNFGGSSVVYQSAETSIQYCDLIPIDDFVKENGIKKVDLIKLDVEGAEAQTLEGAKKTITQFKPKLIVSAYHLIGDFFELILKINSIQKGYKFYMGHHSVGYYETVIYAIYDKNL